MGRCFPLQPQRAGEDPLRASPLDDGEGRLQGRGLPRDAGDPGAPRHPDVAARARGPRPRQGRCPGPDFTRKPATRAERGRSAVADRRFPKRREALVAAAAEIAEREDARGQKRRRVFDSLLILRFVLRLVAAPRGPGYTGSRSASSACGGVDGRRGAGEARLCRVPAPARGDPRPRSRRHAPEGPQDPRRRRLEDHPA